MSDNKGPDKIFMGSAIVSGIIATVSCVCYITPDSIGETTARKITGAVVAVIKSSLVGIPAGYLFGSLASKILNSDNWPSIDWAKFVLPAVKKTSTMSMDLDPYRPTGFDNNAFHRRWEDEQASL